jgi:hypothetical protein
MHDGPTMLAIPGVNLRLSRTRLTEQSHQQQNGPRGFQAGQVFEQAPLSQGNRDVDGRPPRRWNAIACATGVRALIPQRDTHERRESSWCVRVCVDR